MYGIEGTSYKDIYYFVRDREGNFKILPKMYNESYQICWEFLTNNGKVYGRSHNPNFRMLFMWDEENGLVHLGDLPTVIRAVNDLGQVLIESGYENENGKLIRRPIIWQNGKITKLYGLCDELGIESEESYGYDMNNKGDVVGRSLVNIIYKNKVCKKEFHAVKWSNGQAIDLHSPKAGESAASVVNDLGDFMINKFFNEDIKLNNIGYLCRGSIIFHINGDSYMTILSKSTLNDKMIKDANSIW